MIFSTGQVLASVLTLASLVTASPVSLEKRGQNVILGYRVVDAAQAARYNSAGTVTDDANTSGVQLGKGAYTSPGPGEWAKVDPWYCVILVDSDALNRVSKAWVPKTYWDQTLWWATEDILSKYIKVLNDSWDPAKTLRMSIIDGDVDGKLQLLIPPGLLNSNGGGMGMSAYCKQDLKDLPSVVVDYDDWQNNIAGSRT